jgi:hypothetical protein
VKRSTLVALFAGALLLANSEACSPSPIPPNYVVPNLKQHVERLISESEVISEVEITKVEEEWRKSPRVRRIHFKTIVSYKSDDRGGKAFAMKTAACDHMIEYYEAGMRKIVFLKRPTPKSPLQSAYFPADEFFSFSRDQVESEARSQLTRTKK